MGQTWNGLAIEERATLMTMAALHRELGPDGQFETEAVELVHGRACRAELGFLTMFGLLDRMPVEDGKFAFRLNGDGLAVIPDSEERRALTEHREKTAQELREEER